MVIPTGPTAVRDVSYIAVVYVMFGMVPYDLYNGASRCFKCHSQLWTEGYLRSSSRPSIDHAVLQ